MADFCDLIYFKDRRQPLREPVHALHGALVARRRKCHRASSDAVSRRRRGGVHARNGPARRVRPEDPQPALAGRADDGAAQRRAGCPGSDALHWCTLRREWKNGDRLAIVLPMRLWVSRFDPSQAYPAAIVYGPVVLAARAADPGFVGKIDLEHLDRDLTPVPGEALTWRLSRDPGPPAALLCL